MESFDRSIAMTYTKPILRTVEPEIDYPDGNGESLSDNTKQLAWIILIKTNLDALFASTPLVFIAGDLLWYPIEGQSKKSAAPDVMVVFGRNKDHRRSYKQWQEENIAPQVTFEILSHCNTSQEMEKKLMFYNEHGVEEYYIYDPDTNHFRAWIRNGVHLELVASDETWVSPRLGIRFDLSGEEMQIFDPNDRLFTTYQVERSRYEAERSRSEAMAQKLRELGIDPSTL
jgi:Uma2 family endonuclease